MASSVVFEWLCDQLETATSMSRLESRGTVRLSLKAAGLDPGTVTPRELEVVLERVLPRELESRNIEDWNEICEELARQLRTATLMEPETAERPESVFARLGR
jgi:hypothetical protein